MDESIRWNFVDKNTNEKFYFQFIGKDTYNNTPVLKQRRSRDEGQYAGDHDYDLMSFNEQGVELHYRHVRGQEIKCTPAVQFVESQILLGKKYVTTPEMLNPATGAKTEWDLLDLPEARHRHGAGGHVQTTSRSTCSSATPSSARCSRRSTSGTPRTSGS